MRLTRRVAMLVEQDAPRSIHSAHLGRQADLAPPRLYRQVRVLHIHRHQPRNLLLQTAGRQRGSRGDGLGSS